MIYIKISKKLIAALIAFVVCQQSAAEDLEPFESWASKRPKWTEDVTEVAYATTRCGTLLMAIGGVFIENPSKDEDIQKGKEVRDRGFELTLFGNLVAETKGMSKESQTARFGLLYKSYAERIVNNRRLHNNMFHGFIQSDFKFCLNLEAEYREMKDKNKTAPNQKQSR